MSGWVGRGGTRGERVGGRKGRRGQDGVNGRGGRTIGRREGEEWEERRTDVSVCSNETGKRMVVGSIEGELRTIYN